ncbi:unnamed protein product [Adineta ricciae]|uniref:Uncharacterized protein n=1 Tax=Adineta ricciae TaxID=249248 RepID=A0A815RG61_ADIRI|nr:unnamed protein product [Adineta ricciae]CAF1652590.1 unnamed protein product [Adineta ricciae]
MRSSQFSISSSFQQELPTTMTGKYDMIQQSQCFLLMDVFFKLNMHKKLSRKDRPPQVTVRKISVLDDHDAMTFPGLTADARTLMHRARIECQSHRLNVEDPVTIEYITRFIADLQQTIENTQC